MFGQPMVFHCNHYNRTLQQFIEDPDYVDSERIFRMSSAETVYLQMREFLKQYPQADFEGILRVASDLFQFSGFGKLDFSGISEDGGAVVGEESHFGRALRLNVGDRDVPGEYLDQGFVAGVLLAASHHLDLPLADGFEIHQTKSISMGDERCRFEVDPRADYGWLEKLRPDPVRSLPTAPGPEEFVPAEDLEVDEKAIIEAVADLDLSGNEDGLIPRFGLYLTRNYADYYNKSSFRFMKAVEREMGSLGPAETLLKETGHICGFHTFGGIMTSPEWEAVVEPQIDSLQGWVHGMVAIINALGWGVWRVEELVPDDRLVVRAYNAYESTGHLRWFGESEDPVEFLVQGGASALMNLVYYGDIAERDSTSKELYYKLFKEKGGFDAEFTHSIAAGDDYVRVEVTR
ncbi:hypothetical protein BRD00_03230 [Halobacteriales archaeon QS_8_69_26]|nr:MAG: hypothetical protein BRD00_03230 [Halobacteriales archaeon QS_8_69_26]